MLKNGKAALAASAAVLALIAAPPILAQGKGNEGGGGGPAAASQGPQGNDDGKGAGGGKPGSGGNDRNEPPAVTRGTRDRGGQSDALRRGNANDASGAVGARGNSDTNTPVAGRDGNSSRDRGQGNAARGNQVGGDGIRGAPARNLGGPVRIDGTNRFAFRELRDTFGSRPRLINGCPPGLAKKRNGCLPPGQAQTRYRSFEPNFFGLFGAESGRYFYEDGYLLRYRPDGLAGFLPLLGGALGIGNIWPDYYDARPVPAYYSDYYRLGDSRGYRYADNVIYRVNPETAAITSVAGLLTGDEFEIGRPMPRGYDVYNVPYGHRKRYYDTPQARYRYANGYIYEIDPGTALVASAIQLAF